MVGIIVLLSGWTPGTYFGLEVGWLVPPIILQLAVGADLLWRERRLVALALIPPVVYLCRPAGCLLCAGAVNRRAAA